jgi:hypothetical protein
MGGESIVDIGGHQYRYEYDPDTGKTLYRGPVGDSPPLAEAEFFNHMSKASLKKNKGDWFEVATDADVWKKDLPDRKLIADKIEEGIAKEFDGSSVKVGVPKYIEYEVWYDEEDGKRIRYFRIAGPFTVSHKKDEIAKGRFSSLGHGENLFRFYFRIEEVS